LELPIGVISHFKIHQSLGGRQAARLQLIMSKSAENPLQALPRTLS